MGLFDKIFGRNASDSMKQPDAQQQFNALRQKYGTALTVADQQGVQLTDLHLQGNQLYVKGIAPSEDAKNKMWDQIKLADPGYSDLVADISVKPQQAQAAPAANQTYVVKAGDNLSKISKHFYGNADEYMRIFYANRNVIDDPDMIKVGQELQIPADDTP
jgi:nucleoid-associated protein YgaU